jgi:hypothetical protein
MVHDVLFLSDRLFVDCFDVPVEDVEFFAPTEGCDYFFVDHLANFEGKDGEEERYELWIWGVER